MVVVVEVLMLVVPAGSVVHAGAGHMPVFSPLGQPLQHLHHNGQGGGCCCAGSEAVGTGKGGEGRRWGGGGVGRGMLGTCSVLVTSTLVSPCTCIPFLELTHFNAVGFLFNRSAKHGEG